MTKESAELMPKPQFVPVNFHKVDLLTSKVSVNEVANGSVLLNHILLIQDTYNDKAPLISLSSDVKVTLAVVMTLSLLIGSVCKGIMYVYVSTTNKKRPINTLIITSAIIHHTTHLFSGTWYILVLLVDSPLSDLLGSGSCYIMMSIGVFGLVYLSVGSLGISVYRIMYIKREIFVKNVIGENRLLVIILSTSLLLTGLASELFMAQETAERTGINMCTGLSVTQTQIYTDYKLSIGDEIGTTLQGERITIGLCLVSQTIELVIYIWFFHMRYKNDNGSITGLMRQEDTHKRNLKNIGTFLGQFYSFVIEYSFLISLLLCGIFADENTQTYRALVVLMKFVDFGVLSCVEVLSSPQLRSFMK